MKYSKVIETHEKRLGERSSASPFMNEIKRMARGVTSLENLAMNRNPKHTEEAHISEIAKASRRLKIEADASNERLNNIYRSKLIQLDNAIQEKAGLYVSNDTAQEIRQALRTMPEKDRINAINEAVQRGDGAVIKAIHGSSQLLTGISADIANRSLEQLQKNVAGDLVAQREALDDDFMASMAVIKDVNSAVKSGFNPSKLKEIEEAERIHTEAAQAFEGAFGDVSDGN